MSKGGKSELMTPEAKAARVAAVGKALSGKTSGFGADFGDYFKNEDDFGPETDRKSKSSKKKELVVVRANRVKPIRKEFLWRPVLALGAATLLTGMPKLGKSQIAEEIAALVSSGRPFPDEDPNSRHEPGTVFILTTEDGAADTVVPRLMAMGAEMRNIRLVQSAKVGDERVGFDLSADLGLLEKAISDYSEDGTTDSDPPKLVIISPITAYLGGKADSNNVSQVRAVLDPLNEMLSRLRLAGLFIGHPKKGSSDEMACPDSRSSLVARAIRWGWLPGKTFGHPVNRSGAADLGYHRMRCVGDAMEGDRNALCAKLRRKFCRDSRVNHRVRGTLRDEHGSAGGKLPRGVLSDYR